MPRTSITFSRRAVASAAALAALSAPCTAAAESPVASHVAAAQLDWIAQLPAARFGPRPPICLIDTGVAVTPDTPATSPTGPIVARLSVYEGDDGTGGDSSHGTMMASAMAAPANGWGIVGVWPGARIVSVRASLSAELFDSAAVSRALQLCQNWSIANGEPLAAVNLSLGSPGNDPALEVRMNNRVADMLSQGVSVIGAAGNVTGAGTAWPASTPGAIAVGAGTPAGAWCGYASRDDRTRLVAPGCDVAATDLATGREGVWPGGGSSHSAAVVSATIAALRSLRPDLGRAGAEAALLSTGATLGTARVLDGRAAAAAAGITDVPPPAAPPATVAPPAPGSTSGPHSDLSPVAVAMELDAPRRVRVQRTRRTVKVIAAAPKGSPAGTRLQIAVRSSGRWRLANAGKTATLRHPASKTLWMRWSGPQARSPWTRYKRPTARAARYWTKTRAQGPRPPLGY